MTKCIGCGVSLSLNKDDIGFTNNIESNLCNRCFNIKNYNKYLKIEKPIELKAILKEMKESKDIIVFVCDIFTISKKVKEMIDFLNNNVILCITKMDLVNNLITEEKVLNYIDKLNIKCLEKIVISSKNNYNLDELFEIINNYKVSKNVYLAGFTNTGKSTLINKIVRNYTNNEGTLTTSMLPSTTLDVVNVKINDDLNLIDTPGIVFSNIIDVLNDEEIKKIVPKTKIKPQIYQIKTNQTILVEDFLALTIGANNSVVFYASSALKYNRIYKEYSGDLVPHKLKLNNNSEIIINGFGTIKIKNNCEVTLYLREKEEIDIREALL